MRNMRVYLLFYEGLESLTLGFGEGWCEGTQQTVADCYGGVIVEDFFG